MRHFSGEFDGLRLLMEDELDLISGGDGEDADEIPTVTVVGHSDNTKTYYMTNLAYWGVGPATGSATSPEPTDASSIHIDVNLKRALNADEQKALDHLVDSVQKTTAAVNSIPDSARLTLSNGQSVTGAELKQIWSNTDFVINDNNFVYSNGTTRGEANDNNGNAVVSFNISTLTGYDAVANGMDYLPLHELGHMTAAGKFENAAYGSGAASNNQNEQIANDIAYAIASYAGEGTVASPGGGYSQVHPVFTP